uniref:Uncharacterized protein n=1 Tax=Oxyrrhis marina TaxID=2969 RepID=A0A7S3UIL2_OXYMA
MTAVRGDAHRDLSAFAAYFDNPVCEVLARLPSPSPLLEQPHSVIQPAATTAALPSAEVEQVTEPVAAAEPPAVPADQVTEPLAAAGMTVDVDSSIDFDAEIAARHQEARSWFEAEFDAMVARGESPTHAAAAILGSVVAEQPVTPRIWGDGVKEQAREWFEQRFQEVVARGVSPTHAAVEVLKTAGGCSKIEEQCGDAFRELVGGGASPSAAAFAVLGSTEGVAA